MAEKRVSVRLAAVGGRQVRAELEGVGEAGSVGGLAAGMNAVMDALAQVGVSEFNMPATPGRVWQAIQAAR